MNSAGHVARAPRDKIDTFNQVEAVVPHKWMKMFKQILAKLSMLSDAANQNAAKSFGSQYCVS